jgi:hypothetical protein
MVEADLTVAADTINRREEQFLGDEEKGGEQNAARKIGHR